MNQAEAAQRIVVPKTWPALILAALAAGCSPPPPPPDEQPDGGPRPEPLACVADPEFEKCRTQEECGGELVCAIGIDGQGCCVRDFCEARGTCEGPVGCEPAVSSEQASFCIEGDSCFIHGDDPGECRTVADEDAATCEIAPSPVLVVAGEAHLVYAAARDSEGGLIAHVQASFAGDALSEAFQASCSTASCLGTVDASVAGATCSSPALVLPPGFVRVLVTDGNFVAGARVVATINGESQEFVTDAHGIAVLPSPPSLVLVEGEGYTPAVVGVLDQTDVHVRLDATPSAESVEPDDSSLNTPAHWILGGSAIRSYAKLSVRSLIGPATELADANGAPIGSLGARFSIITRDATRDAVILDDQFATRWALGGPLNDIFTTIGKTETQLALELLDFGSSKQSFGTDLAPTTSWTIEPDLAPLTTLPCFTSACASAIVRLEIAEHSVIGGIPLGVEAVFDDDADGEVLSNEAHASRLHDGLESTPTLDIAIAVTPDLRTESVLFVGRATAFDESEPDFETAACDTCDVVVVQMTGGKLTIAPGTLEATLDAATLAGLNLGTVVSVSAVTLVDSVSASVFVAPGAPSDGTTIATTISVKAP